MRTSGVCLSKVACSTATLACIVPPIVLRCILTPFTTLDKSDIASPLEHINVVARRIVFFTARVWVKPWVNDRK